MKLLAGFYLGNIVMKSMQVDKLSVGVLIALLLTLGIAVTAAQAVAPEQQIAPSSMLLVSR
jgi:hypothetical protein